MKRILALHTGGTISMSQDENGEVTPNSANPIASATGPLNDDIELINEEVFNLPSPHITPKHMLKIKQRIKRAEDEGIDGVVVTHGTDTLEETAYFLDLTLPNTIPVVMTGAMRSSNQIGSDGLYNFQSAVLVAATAEAYGKGVLVVMNDEIHTARYVTKTHTTNVDTFRTPTFGPIGLIVEHKAVFFQELVQSEVCDIDQVIDNVYLLEAYAGMDSFLFDAIDRPETKGLVLEGTGAGNVPPETLDGISKLLANDIPIVLVSRCYNGVAQDIYGYEGGGIELKKMGVTFCRGLNGPKARIKLLVGLSAGKTGADLVNFVSDAIS
ncbi:Asparaginase [Lentilactobacillus senioris DSM 24302 = JCM 17472]|uniref:Asparaginase n=1 Tax=Lentilactobacillus senioris DSM 24302 = JCM 17472 TaxID=1423802 RepID=A0A0R2CNJ2_9LACO|nr:asparaginase [Lentilactobacillus senioris]KRM93245.1 Asparaginase [Lentilactobacillus senioris DSM 24302 = JCM 17472]